MYAAFNKLNEGESLNSTDYSNANNSDNNAATIVDLLKSVKLDTLILDEAHHLKNEWWKALQFLEESLNPSIIGLTATPPYDVTGIEWDRYISLNGPIDEEIHVPELVSAGDLCPHQDYIYFNMPTDLERGVVLDYREKTNTIFNKIRQDESIITDIESFPFIQNPTAFLDWIYDNIEQYMGCLVLINDFRGKIDNKHLVVLGDEELEVPNLTFAWLERALYCYCFKAHYFFEDNKEFELKVENLISRFRRYGVIEKQQISFGLSQKTDGLLVSSINKLTSILDIVDFESLNLKSDLRMVILSDYIRKEVHVHKEENDSVLAKLGVMPIFEYLRRHKKNAFTMGVLTGSIVVIPISGKLRLEELLAERTIANVQMKELQYDNAYIEIIANTSIKHLIIQFVTILFEEGYINVLIGTKSLLGEGWDAPTINSLILASFVGSYVSSNQMRGRAIRSVIGNKSKTANIWHLVTIDPYVEDGGGDIKSLTRRFKAFVGISNFSNPTDMIISNGTRRLNLPKKLLSQQDVVEYNQFTFELAKNRSALPNKWELAISNGTSLVHQIKIPFMPLTKGMSVEENKTFYSKKTIIYTTASLSTLIFLFILNKSASLYLNITLFSGLNLYTIILWATNVFTAIKGYKFYKKAVKNKEISEKYTDISKDVTNIALALFDTLYEFGFITTPKDRINVNCRVSVFGTITCALHGATISEGNLFVDCMQEILAPITNPRYIIERKSFLAYKNSQSDFHAIPECIATNRKMVDFFSKKWSYFVGKNEVFYTRTPEGRKLLLRFRVHNLANQLADDPLEIENAWM